jgi:hypothetical protein
MTARSSTTKASYSPAFGFIVTNITLPSGRWCASYTKRGTAEQWIKEGKQPTHRTRLSRRRFRPNEVRLQLSVLAYNLGNLRRRVSLPQRVKTWSFDQSASAAP